MAYNITDQFESYFITFTTVGGIDVFTKKQYRDILLESMRFCQTHKGLKINAYVIMSNHVHLVCYSVGQKLSDILRDLKKFTARKIIDNIFHQTDRRKDWLQIVMRYHARKHMRRSEYQLWEHNNHAVRLSDLKMLYQKLDYIHDNPVKAGIVSQPSDYIYSSARNYAGQHGIIAVEVIDIVPLVGYVKGP